MSGHKITKVRLPSGLILTLELCGREDEAEVRFGRPEEPPGWDVSPDEWRAEIQWPQNVRMAPVWRLRYWAGNQTQGRLSPVRYGTPGDVVRARIGGGLDVIRVVNEAVYAHWPGVNPERESVCR